MGILEILLLINYTLALFAIIDMIFFSGKKPRRIIAWIVLLGVPFIGLFIYFIIGAGLSWFVKRMINKYKFSSYEYMEHINNQKKTLGVSDQNAIYPEEHKDLIMLNLNTCGGIFSLNNDYDYFFDGPSALESLKNDIKNAKSTIHLEFYIFENDNTGHDMINLLIEKAKQGVEVRVLYDAVGSIRVSKFAFRKLKKAGAQVTTFFPPFLNIKVLNFKANYRNHRKICVIDGKIAYTGGFNIRDDHMGLNKHLSPWRDTTARFVGASVHSFQNIFLADWRFASRDSTDINEYKGDKYFPINKSEIKNSKIPMQVITSGPESLGDPIKECMIKMIHQAKKSIKIQTPYFIPDEAFLDALKLALLSGIEVTIIIPKKVDHWHVHYASFGYLNDLLRFGVKAYLYNGFIHSKVLMVDDKIMTFGSCNIDIRSFALNFEDNVVVYDSKKTHEYSKHFEKDLKNSFVYDETARKKRNVFAKMLTSFCRLFSAIL